MKKLYHSHLMDAQIDFDNKRIYFWGGIYSQWVKCKIVDPANGVEFNCAEQAMMYYKAMVFQDKEAMAAVLAESNPKKQKNVGRTIKNYDDAVWVKERYDIVVRNNVLKFMQNPAWRELLFYTEGYEIVEASPLDKVWGVGLGQEDPKIRDKANWQGENLLGKAIMEARELLLDQLDDE